MRLETTYTAPAGTYWLGDPCYSVPDCLWDQLLDSNENFSRAVGKVAGWEVIGFPTFWGDGVYTDQQGREYGVDAGVIGLVPADIFPDPAPGLAHRITFDAPFACGEDDGVLVFGLVVIDTKSEEG